MQRSISRAAGVLLLAALVVATMASDPSEAAAQAQDAVPPELVVTPLFVEVGESLTATANPCPDSSITLGGSYSVTFSLEYLLPPDAPNDSYIATQSAPSNAAGEAAVTFTLPVDAPTIGGAYRVSAQCTAEELGNVNTIFDYPPVGIGVSPGPVLAVSPPAIVAGESITARGDRCPDSDAQIAALFEVEFTFEYLLPPDVTADSYSETKRVQTTDGVATAEFTLSADAPTAGGAYRVLARCTAEELGFINEEFVYRPVIIDVSAPPTPTPTPDPTATPVPTATPAPAVVVVTAEALPIVVMDPTPTNVANSSSTTVNATPRTAAADAAAISFTG